MREIVLYVPRWLPGEHRQRPRLGDHRTWGTLCGKASEGSI